MVRSELVALAVLSCAWAHPHPRPHPRPYYPAYPYYNLDAVSVGGGEGSQGATVLSRYYQPYSYGAQPYLPAGGGGGGGGGMAAFMYGTRAEQGPAREHAAAQLYPSFEQQERAPFRPSAPQPTPPAPAPELLDATEAATPRAATQDLATERDAEELEPTPRPSRRRLVHKKPHDRPADEEEDEEAPFPPMNAYFPMFFGYGRRGGSSGGGGGAGGATAIANAYSTGRGGVATSHATAYGPRPDQRR